RLLAWRQRPDPSRPDGHRACQSCPCLRARRNRQVSPPSWLPAPTALKASCRSRRHCRRLKPILPAAPPCNRPRSIPRYCRGIFHAATARPPARMAAARVWDAQPPSPRDLPSGTILGIFQHDAHGSEFIADTVGFSVVFFCMRCCPSPNQTYDLVFVDGKRRRAEGRPFGRRQLQQADQLRTRLQRGRRRSDTFRSLATQIVQRGEGLRCIEIIQQRTKRVCTKIAGLYVSGQAVPVIEILLRLT